MWWWVIAIVGFLVLVGAYLESSPAANRRRKLKARKRILPPNRSEDIVVPSILSTWLNPGFGVARYGDGGATDHGAFDGGGLDGGDFDGGGYDGGDGGGGGGGGGW